MSLNIIVAVAKNGVIGKGDGLPWRIKEDLQYFKATTLGKYVVMGRKTFEGLPGVLPDRKIVVFSKDRSYIAKGASVLHHVDDIIRMSHYVDVFISGGSEIYKLFLPMVNTLYLTEVDLEPEGDNFWTGINEADWREESSEEYVSEKAGTRVKNRVLKRIRW